MVKFVFTRVLNNILEHVAEVGARAGMSRYEMSYITIEKLLHTNKFASAESFSQLVRR